MTDRISIEATGEGAWDKARGRLEEYDVDMSALRYVGIELQYDDGELCSIELSGIDHEDNAVEDESPAERSTRTYDGPQTYDVREQPARGRILDVLATSDGVTEDSLLRLADVSESTGTGYLNRMMSWGGIADFEENGNTYYRITARGEKVLSVYRRRWRSGFSNLPHGFWPEHMGFDPLEK